MKLDNGTRVRVKIPGHCTYGVVVETVPAFERPTAKPDRFYTHGGTKPVMVTDKTDTASATETMLIRIDSLERKPLYRVLPSMVEAL